MPVKKEVLYPIFLECCQYTDDIFWENIFEELAYGKTPYSTYISKNFLCCSVKKREFSYKIENKPPEQVHDEVYDLLTNKVGLLSQREKAKKKQSFSDLEETRKETRKSWNDIKKKNIKELLIELFVSDMQKKYSLSIKQSQYLLAVIGIAMAFKIINSDDIDYTDGRIQNIEGIRFERRKIVFDRDMYDIDTVHIPHMSVDKKIMSDTWVKYLKEIQKQEI